MDSDARQNLIQKNQNKILSECRACVRACVRIVCVRESRVTGILSHVLIGLSVLFIEQLKLIPRPVLDGLFLYLAITALHSNQLFERITLLVTEQVNRQSLNETAISSVHTSATLHRNRHSVLNAPSRAAEGSQK